MKVELDDKMMRSLVAEALFQALDEQKREALVKGAIEHLLTPPAESYGRRPVSPMADAFNWAVRAQAQRIAEEMLDRDESFRDRMRELINEALVRLFDTNREKTVEKLTDAIAAGLAYRERD